MNRRLQLDLSELSVESFVTVPDPSLGTGESISAPVYTEVIPTVVLYTDDYSCARTCGEIDCNPEIPPY